MLCYGSNKLGNQRSIILSILSGGEIKENKKDKRLFKIILIVNKIDFKRNKTF